MKFITRIFISTVCIPAVLFSMTAYAEDAVLLPSLTVEPAVEQMQPKTTEAPPELPLIEAEMETPVPTKEIDMQTEQPLPEVTSAPVVDEIVGVAQGKDYSSGYVRLVEPAMGYAGASPDADGVIYLESGVLYVSDRRASLYMDRLRVHFGDGNETRSVWVDERYLRPMSADEVHFFVQNRLQNENVRLYGGDPSLPLDMPTYSAAITYSDSLQQNAEIPAMLVGQTQLCVYVGETLSIHVDFSDGENHAVRYESENPDIASVSDDGHVTGVCAGNVRVRLKSEFGNIADIEVLVQE